MMFKQPPWQPARLACAVSLATLFSTSAQAVTFKIGEIEGQFDSSLSVGASWSTQSADSDLVGAHNGGDGVVQAGDDGRLNFKKGETFSKIFKGIHDLELKYGDTGVFVRGKYWYDFELKDENRLFKDIDEHNRKTGAQSSGAELLDAFVYHNYSIDDLPGSVRLGKQVVSWGESTFIFNSINSINPVDVSAFRRPGAEIKEGLIPVNMFYVSQSLTDNLSAEAFYQLEWDQTVVDNCGTFFATPDVVADGCDRNLTVLSPALAGMSGFAAAQGLGYESTSEGVIIPRGGDRDARDSGQFGTALRYFAEDLGTEFGAFFMNYHSRMPVFSATAANPAVFAAIAPPSLANPAGGSLFQSSFGPLLGACGGDLACAVSSYEGLATATVAGNSQYFIEYPEDIRLYGLSFSTTLPTGTAWSGEISYRPNAPVQLNTVDILFGGLTPADPSVSPIQATPGEDTHGYRRKEITQAQTTLVHFFDQVMGADRLTLIGEVGFTHVGGLESSSKLRYGRDPVFGSGVLPSGRCESLNASILAGVSQKNLSRYCEDEGFVTSDSWGYRARAIWEYNNLIPGIELKPSIAWSHDVKGYGPNGLFNEDAKAISLGLDANYLSTYTAGLSYTNFFGGKYNTSVDRDFVALSFGMSF